jgi:hypothetical protein
MCQCTACARSPVRVRLFGARGPRQIARGRATLDVLRKTQENEYADTCFAGAVRPRAALFVWRVRELCTRHVVTKPFAAQTWRVAGVNRAHGADLAEDAAKAPVVSLDCSYGLLVRP